MTTISSSVKLGSASTVAHSSNHRSSDGAGSKNSIRFRPILTIPYIGQSFLDVMNALQSMVSSRNKYRPANLQKFRKVLQVKFFPVGTWTMVNVESGPCTTSYNHSMEACSLSWSYVPSAVVKENLKKYTDGKFLLGHSCSCPWSCFREILTVFLGSTFAIRIAAFMASTEGLQRMGDLGLNPSDSFRSTKLADVSSLSSMQFWDWLEPLQGFSVSKHITPSKQPCKPSLCRASSACDLSEFVNTCNNQN